MNIDSGKYKIEMTRTELIKLDRALDELNIMQTKYPNELNGYNADISTTVDYIHKQIKQSLAK